MVKRSEYLNEERLTAACVLSLVGGFTDVYSYLCRGHVFANAVTGNMVLLGLNVSQGAWAECGKYLLAIFAYGCGVFAADAIHAKVEHHRLMSWHQAVLALEIVLLSAVVFVPYGAADFLVDALIAFVCALQVQTFRRVRGLPFASTMCTGNLRSGSDALFNGLRGADETGIRKARHYFVVIGIFILGAVLGAILLKSLGPNSFALAPLALLVVFGLLTGKRQLVHLRRIGRWLRGKRRTGKVVALLVALFASGSTFAALEDDLPAIFSKCAAHYRALDAAASRQMRDANGEAQVPHGFNRATGKLDMRNWRWWTTGHYPGSLWLLHEATGDEFFKTRALAWQELVKGNAAVTDNHDIGFIMNCSFGNARRILKTREYDNLLVETAHSLSRRFSDSLGLIRSWGDIADGNDFLVIPDNLMNLELLEVAAAISGNDRFSRIARSHADVSMRHHFRPDGGCFHVLNYNQQTRRVKEIRSGQGASCETAWSRGQAWGIYGYTMMFRFTRDLRHLKFAQKLADYAMNHPNMPADGVPYWDFGAPGEERDASAASIMASGLLELAALLPANEGSHYREFARKQLTSLSSTAYFNAPGENGDWILKHGVGNKPEGTEIDTPLDYADYYYLEALLRLKPVN